jgi:MFS family permease
MFATNGMAYGSWVPRLPEVRESLHIGDAALGFTLLGGAVGGLAMSLASGAIVDRVGSRFAMVSTSLALALLLPLIAVAPSPPVLFGVLVAVGALDGITDVAQNAQAIEVQGRQTRSVLNRMHALWSIGTLLGGLVASRAAAADVSFTLQLSVTAVLLVGVCLAAAPRLLPRQLRAPHAAPSVLALGPGVAGEAWASDPSSASGAGRSPARAAGRLLALLFAMGAAAVLMEIPPTEWASLLLAQRFDVSTGTAALGFVAFTIGMVAGRLVADVVVDRIGSESTRRRGAVLSLVGLAVVVTSPVLWLAVAGFLLAGLGGSTQFPMAVRRAGELLHGSSQGVAVFASGARAGMLLGAPAMGAISEATSRSTALLLVAGSAAVVSVAVRLPDDPDHGRPPATRA